MITALGKLLNKIFVRGADLSLDYNRIHGKWYVVYPDGARSQRMCYDTARIYSNIYNGQVKHISESD